MSVYLDTSGIYAYLVRSEERHQDTVRAFRKVLDEGRPIWSTSYVLVETIALLQHRVGLGPVREMSEDLLPLLSIEWVSESLHRKGMERLVREDRRRLSLVDCVSLEFMRSRGLRDALSLDAQFAEAGFRLLPPAP
jgi:predicted nucleic acid-binding protein